MNEPLLPVTSIGMMQNGRMSAVRRFFCLIVTFDLIFTSLLWLVCVMLSDVRQRSIETALYNEIVAYNIHSSLFDLVMVAVCRFTVLLLFYALLHINHWSVIALCTAGSCAFLIVKVFFYEWQAHSNYTFAVMLLLISCVLSWGEAWFLDFRVLPKEQQAQDLLRASHLAGGSLSGVYRHPRFFHDNETVGSFHSAVDPDSGSEHSILDDTVEAHDSRPPGDQTPEENEYRQKADEALSQAWTLIHSSDWRLETKKDNGDLVYTQQIGKGRHSKTIFFLTADIDASMDQLNLLLFDNLQDIPVWNPSLLEYRVIQKVDDNVQVTYQVAAEIAGGLVSPRDFVTVRFYGQKDECIVSAGKSIKFPAMPPQRNYVRGETEAGCWLLKPVPGHENRCTFQWLLHSDLKGWLPQALVDTAIGKGMLDVVHSLRKHIDKANVEKDI